MPKVKDEGTAGGVPALVVTPNKAPAVGGNFEQIESFLKDWKTKVLSMDMTADNMEEVRVIKKEAVQYRNSLAKIQSDVKKLYFNDPKSVFDAKMGVLLAVVGDVESAADDVLSEEEEERVAIIREALDAYTVELQKEFKLEEKYLQGIEYKKQYYNKTTPAGYASMDKFQKADLKAQFESARYEQKAYGANLRLIETACKDEQRLNAAHWIKQLEHDDVASIVEQIKAEKERLGELDQKAAAVEEAPVTMTASSGGTAEWPDEEPEQAQKIVIGVTSGIDFETDFKGRIKEIDVRITYQCDQSDALTEVFTRLAKFGIKSKVLPKQAVKRETIDVDEGDVF